MSYEDFLIHEVTIERKLSGDSYEGFEYTAPETVRARVIPEGTMVRTTGGETVRQDRTTAHLEPGVTVAYDDRVTLPDNSKPPITRVLPHSTLVGVHHVEVVF